MLKYKKHQRKEENMTKEQYENYNGLLFCKTCKIYVPKLHCYYKRVYQDGSIKFCNVCQWINRHNGVPNIDGFTEEEIKAALYFFIYEENGYLNTLAENLNKTIEDTVQLYHCLNLTSKKCLIKTKCEVCNKDISFTPKVYLKNKNHYCGYECYWNDKSNKSLHGESSPFYKRVETHCTNCNKSIKVIPYQFNKKNKYGDNHNFCSHECYSEYRSKYYIGSKSSMANYEYTPEEKVRARLRLLQCKRTSERLNTTIQLKVNDMLNKHEINYEREHIIKYYAVDNYLIDYNLIIEVMGDYWHCSPLKYGKDKREINHIQQKVILKDKQKHSYILNHEHINILYLWEYDIHNNPELCEALILYYVNNEGNLLNYHSFNYYIYDGVLTLSDDIITPFQNLKSEQYKPLLKQ